LRTGETTEGGVFSLSSTENPKSLAIL